jgi:gentisate 1,2-dioxygenase
LPTGTVQQMSYEAPKKRAEPYTKIVEELPQMRRDTVQLVRQAVSAGRRAYVLVNNRAEGNAPLTVQALTVQLRG